MSPDPSPERSPERDVPVMVPREGGARPRPPVRWGIGDVFWVWLAQIVGAVVAEVAVVLAVGVDEDIPTEAFFGVVIPVQALTGLAAAVLLVRAKGVDVVHDLGLRVRPRDWTAAPMGLGLQIAFGLMLWPFAELLDSSEPAQELIQTIDEARGGLVWAAIVLGVVVLQPLLEEVMFRGLLLRALLRRTGPFAAVGLSGVAFGVVHVFGTGLTLEAIATIVGLSGLGILLGVQALRHGSLGRPILMHMGFNLLTVVALMTG